MGIETKKFVKKPLYVDAVQITSANFKDIVKLTNGEVKQDDIPGRGKSRKYILIDVHNPRPDSDFQKKAFVGNWLLITERGFKIYTHRAFENSFELVPEDHPIRGLPTPPEEANVSADEPKQKVFTRPECLFEYCPHPELCQERCSNVRPDRAQVKPQPYQEPYPIEVLPREGGMERRHDIEEAAKSQAEAMNLTQSSESVPLEEVSQDAYLQKVREDAGLPDDATLEVATPEALADAVMQNEIAMANEDPTGAETKAEAEESIEPAAAEGKRVLSLKEQKELTPDEVRELIQSGEAVLVQDLNSPTD